MAKQSDPNKPKRVVKPAGPRPVFILIDTGDSGLSADQVKNCIKGFSLDVNAVLDAIEGKSNLGFKRIMIPRTARRKAPGNTAPATA